MLQGKWTYRSFRNTAALVTQRDDVVTSLVLFEGVLDLEDDGLGVVRGAVGMADGAALAVRGAWLAGAPEVYELVAEGVDGTRTAGWRWDLRGAVGHRWTGETQSLTLTGAVRHSGDPALAADGRTASFVAVRHDDEPPPRTERSFALVRDL